jgi:hypothetical protein
MSKILKLNLKFPHLSKYRSVAKNAQFTLLFCQKCLVSLQKTRKSTSSLNTYAVYCRNLIDWLRVFASTDQFHSATLSKAQSLTPPFRQRCWIRCGYKKNRSFGFTFSGTAHRYATRFRRKWGVIRNFEYLGKFEKHCRTCWLYCFWYLTMDEWCKKKLKTDLKIHAFVSLGYFTQIFYQVYLPCYFSDSGKIHLPDEAPVPENPHHYTVYSLH